jgi:putative glutamine amidotransferase
MSKMKIAVTDCSKYDAYASWISTEGNVEPVKIGYEDNSIERLRECDGILLTGGEDVHPRYYGKPEYLPYCHKEDVNEKRDELEFKVLDYSQKNRIPVLGICRGLQVANVYFGGTLVPDIPSFGKFNHSKAAGKDRYHPVRIDPTSSFIKIVGTELGEINSAHHQSAELVAPDLVCNAISQDGVVEGLEWKNPESKPYLMLVQWHPERMTDQSSVFSKNVKTSFLQAVKTK